MHLHATVLNMGVLPWYQPDQKQMLFNDFNPKT